jgi:cystathionine beta-lyase family protein involved in aluminum resistance
MTELFDAGYEQGRNDQAQRDGYYFSQKLDEFTAGYITGKAERDCNRQAAPDMFGHACASLAVEYNFYQPELLLPHIPADQHRSFNESFQDALDYARDKAKKEKQD